MPFRGAGKNHNACGGCRRAADCDRRKRGFSRIASWTVVVVGYRSVRRRSHGHQVSPERQTPLGDVSPDMPLSVLRDTLNMDGTRSLGGHGRSGGGHRVHINGEQRALPPLPVSSVAGKKINAHRRSLCRWPATRPLFLQQAGWKRVPQAAYSPGRTDHMSAVACFPRNPTANDP